MTRVLKVTDGKFVSPVQLREPQLRGLAEPFALTMDFGELDLDKPLVMVMHGWLRFGGGMANIGASLDSNLPFPFPKLEAELPNGKWQEVTVDVGVPAGKTKTILVNLDRQLPRGTKKLRLSKAFELYWDSIIIGERVATEQAQITRLQADRADLRWRGFSNFEPLPSFLPLTPDYEQVSPNPSWRRTPFGWCTRYGDVHDLVNEKDNALALLNGGDELALSFLSNRVPAKPESSARTFVLQVVGWDKDADFHVKEGWRVEPLPFHGMDAQAYGRQPRPELNDHWINQYNTRWVGPLVLQKGRPNTIRK